MWRLTLLTSLVKFAPLPLLMLLPRYAPANLNRCWCSRNAFVKRRKGARGAEEAQRALCSGWWTVSYCAVRFSVLDHRRVHHYSCDRLTRRTRSLMRIIVTNTCTPAPLCCFRHTRAFSYAEYQESLRCTRAAPSFQLRREGSTLQNLS
jgi:hypothetical protein